MPKKTFAPEQIVTKLRQIEVLLSQGKTVPAACKEAGITAQTFYRWRKEYGGLQIEQAKKMRDLQKCRLTLTNEFAPKRGDCVCFPLTTGERLFEPDCLAPRIMFRTLFNSF
jgi:putative transposase